MKVVNRANTKSITTPHGTQITPLIDRSTTSITQCSLAEEILPSGKAIKAHYHKTHEEIYYLLTGSGQMTVGDESQNVSAGDAVYIPINSVHSLENNGPDDIRLVVIVGPAFSFDDVWMDSDTSLEK